MPPALTPNFAQELLDVVALFKPLNREAFRNTIHKALCENAAKVRVLKRDQIDVLRLVNGPGCLKVPLIHPAGNL